MNKTEVLVPAQYSSYHKKLPGHTPLPEPRATPQPSSPKQVSKHSGLSLLPHLQMISLLTLKPRNLLSPTLTVLHTRCSCRFIQLTGSTQRDAFPLMGGGLDLFPQLFSQQMSQGHTTSPSVKAAPFLTTSPFQFS